MVRIESSGLCLQSYPCQHYMTIDGVKRGRMNGYAIVRLYQKHNLPVPPHFQGYMNSPHVNPIKIETGNVCLKGCKHYVTVINKDDKNIVEDTAVLDRNEIVKLHQKYNLYLPKHFEVFEKDDELSSDDEE